MDMNITCPSCGQHLVVDSAATGQQTSCPTCSTPFVIPAIARVAPSPVSAVHGTRRRGTAIFSLVLGILSLPSLIFSFCVLTLSHSRLFLACFGILPQIAAVILGHKAHNRARKLPAQYAGGGMAIAGFILGYISILLSLVMVAFILIVNANARANFRADQIINSENNLKEIGLAFRVWEGDHNDQFPFNVSQAQGGTRELCEPDSNGFEKNPAPTFMVMSNELGTTKILVCSNDKTKQAAADFASLTANNISYQLRTGTNVNENNPTEILAVDPINGIVLHCDGSVEWDFHYKKQP
jgi:Domain of unknown function (DUF4190)